MTTPTSSSSLSVVSFSLPISLVALTNNFSTHLNADNYLLWRDQITPFLIYNDLYGHIDGTDPPPSKTILIDGTASPNPEHARWFKIDQLVVGGIKNTLSSTACAEVLVKMLLRMFGTHLKHSFISRLYLVLISCMTLFLTLSYVVGGIKNTLSSKPTLISQTHNL